MFKKGISILIVLFALQFLLVSCFKQQYCKGKFTSAKCSTSKVLPYPEFNYFDTNTISTIHFDSLTISNQLMGETYDCYYAKIKSLLVTEAYAFQPAPPQIEMQDRLDSIKMITVRNFNATHLAGSSIDDITKHVMNDYNNWNATIINSSELTKNYNDQLSKTIDDLNVDHYSKFTQKPTNSGDTVEISINYYLSNGIILRDTATKFVLVY